MLTTDRGQEISIIDKGIQINFPESTQVINFADIETLTINEDNGLQISASGVVMQYQLVNTDNNQEFINQFGIAKLNATNKAREEKARAEEEKNKGKRKQITKGITSTLITVPRDHSSRRLPTFRERRE